VYDLTADQDLRSARAREVSSTTTGYIKDFKSTPAVDRALPAAGFGAGTYDAKDDDTYENGEVEVDRTYASVRDLGACLSAGAQYAVRSCSLGSDWF